MQARHLVSKWKTHCDCYVKVGLIPDTISSTQCQSDLVSETNSPLFDQKFSL